MNIKENWRSALLTVGVTTVVFGLLIGAFTL